MAITPQFSEQTESAILERLLDAIVPEVDKRQGSIAYDLSDPAAQEFAQAYIALDRTLSYAFLNEDMPSDLLTMAASDLGIDRKSPVAAKGEVTFTGQIGQFIPKDMQVRTDNGVYFNVLNDVILTQETTKVTVEAELGGISGNVRSDEINTVVGDLAGVLTVKNESAFDNGVDKESDESLLQRVYDKVRKPATSGNVYHYEQWARGVSGVGAVRVYPTWNGPNTVKVVLLSDDKRTPSQTVIDESITKIEEERPVGARVTVVGATEISINIDVDLTLSIDATISEVLVAIEKALNEYLEPLAFKDPTVRYNRIAAILLAIPQIVDYENLTVNGDIANIEISDEEVAVLGAVNINEVRS